MTVTERALTFECEGETLAGVLSTSGEGARRGVLIIVGGPQYRAGSHRQFTLLARHLAAQGVPALRFDYRGMGDSGGAARTFESVGADIRSAIDAFFAEVPSLREVALWGLCDGAAAALFYGWQDARVTGLALLNPWVRTEQGAARTYLRHYYASRLVDPALWRKIRSGEFSVRRAAAGFLQLARGALGRRVGPADGGAPADEAATAPLPERMLAGLRRFRGAVLLIVSGNDLTAQEFTDLVTASRDWQRLLAHPRVTRHELPEANHTFARRLWRDEVARWTGHWVRDYGG